MLSACLASARGPQSSLLETWRKIVLQRQKSMTAAAAIVYLTGTGHLVDRSLLLATGVQTGDVVFPAKGSGAVVLSPQGYSWWPSLCELVQKCGLGFASPIESVRVTLHTKCHFKGVVLHGRKDAVGFKVDDGLARHPTGDCVGATFLFHDVITGVPDHGVFYGEIKCFVEVTVADHPEAAANGPPLPWRLALAVVGWRQWTQKSESTDAVIGRATDRFVSRQCYSTGQCIPVSRLQVRCIFAPLTAVGAALDKTRTASKFRVHTVPWSLRPIRRKPGQQSLVSLHQPHRAAGSFLFTNFCMMLLIQATPMMCLTCVTGPCDFNSGRSVQPPSRRGSGCRCR
jgi:hypothetical protein